MYVCVCVCVCEMCIRLCGYGVTVFGSVSVYVPAIAQLTVVATIYILVLTRLDVERFIEENNT